VRHGFDEILVCLRRWYSLGDHVDDSDCHLFRLPRKPLLTTARVAWMGDFLRAIIVAVPTGAFLLRITPLQAVYPKTNQPAPELGFHLLDGGGARNLHDYKGKVVVLNVWATYCKPCRDEMPDLGKLQQQYASQGVVVITVSDEPPGDILKLAGLNSMHSVNAYVEGEQKSSPLLACAVARPVTYIIDSQGVLRETLSGGHDYAFYEQRIRTYLNPVG
jgi:cytochrome c biogenesis protein CcmG, thiol:disulfide interchange protein DsbE